MLYKLILKQLKKNDISINNFFNNFPELITF